MSCLTFKVPFGVLKAALVFSNINDSFLKKNFEKALLRLALTFTLIFILLESTLRLYLALLACSFSSQTAFFISIISSRQHKGCLNLNCSSFHIENRITSLNSSAELKWKLEEAKSFCNFRGSWGFRSEEGFIKLFLALERDVWWKSFDEFLHSQIFLKKWVKLNFCLFG